MADPFACKMTNMLTLLSALPISNEDINTLPIRELDSAVTYSTTVLGFTVIHRDDDSGDCFCFFRTLQA